MEITDQYFVFTNSLSFMTREEAMQIVQKKGGKVQTAVTPKTNFLVAGFKQMDCFDLERVTKKENDAADLIKKGHKITILGEEAFLSLINKQ
ncbi:NAD-dependent DNA ligase [Enterococcus sp. PF1-24]|uniref:BRCT domain-containing protein n=1 Tax=unclassified Enterococcus TaxID=2608891 RepID=UPI0024735457|nr:MULTISPECIES: BRCT domain-containing protein [unclassified Enterococcus]MDH6364531.1 NAD-dependent DNA ligase [Enterococcus sp. PFB1-1]MDH6401592.1 NAD-dependent DNA ligase [Enterococcus sp. PF1-24]